MSRASPPSALILLISSSLTLVCINLYTINCGYKNTDYTCDSQYLISIFFLKYWQYISMLNRYHHRMLVKFPVVKYPVTLKCGLEITLVCCNVMSYYTVYKCKGFSVEIIDYSIVLGFSSHLYMVI